MGGKKEALDFRHILKKYKQKIMTDRVWNYNKQDSGIIQYFSPEQPKDGISWNGKYWYRTKNEK